MKIFAIGDFHGKFPEKLRKIARKKDVDLILSLGDYANADKIRKIIFKSWTDKKWYETIGLKKARQLEKESYDSGLDVLKKLNSLNKKVYLIWGNTDFYRDYITSELPIVMPGFYDDKLKKFKNLILIDRKKKTINNIEILGHGGYLDVTEYIKNSIDKNKKKQKKRLKRYFRQAKELKKLFLRKNPKDFIFLTHYTPLNCLDKVDFKTSPMNGKHMGFESYNQIIKKYKPLLVICGHMHENQGKCNLGKSIIVNPGAAFEGKAAIIDIEGDKKGKKKIKSIKFIR